MSISSGARNVPREFVRYASNREVPKNAMRCIACDRILPASASAVLTFIDDRWTVWHKSCFTLSWRTSV